LKKRKTLPDPPLSPESPFVVRSLPADAPRPVLGQRFLAVMLLRGTWPMFGFFKEALQGIQRVAFSQGYGLLVVNPAPEKELDVENLVNALRKTVDGLLLVAPTENVAFFDSLARDKFPVVVLYRRYPQLSYVEVDNEGGAFQAVEHLIHLGHSRIAFLNGPPDAVDGQERLAGYLKALGQHSLPYRKEYVVQADFEQAKGYRAMKELLKLKSPPTAVFAANDYMALGAISAVHDEGLSVPGHVAVVGFDDLEMPALTFRAPSLTTVRQPIYEIAKEGTESLILLVEGRVTEIRQKVFPSQLIVRSTCGASLKRPPAE
jgi:DNA-binding LacI/PurR family transcriptional regulator